MVEAGAMVENVWWYISVRFPGATDERSHSEWYELGLQLGVDDAELEVIGKNNRGDLRACQRNVFSTWLRITRSPSYQPLVEALMAVGEAKEAGLLCKKNILSEQLHLFDDPSRKFDTLNFCFVFQQMCNQKDNRLQHNKTDCACLSIGLPFLMFFLYWLFYAKNFCNILRQLWLFCQYVHAVGTAFIL